MIEERMGKQFGNGAVSPVNLREAGVRCTKNAFGEGACTSRPVLVQRPPGKPTHRDHESIRVCGSEPRLQRLQPGAAASLLNEHALERVMLEPPSARGFHSRVPPPVGVVA